MIAASEKASGIVRMFCRRRNTAKALKIEGAKTPRNEFSRPKERRTKKLGIMVTCPGIIIVLRNRVKSTSLPLKEIFANT